MRLVDTSKHHRTGQYRFLRDKILYRKIYISGTLVYKLQCLTCGKVEKIGILPGSRIQNKGRSGREPCKQTHKYTLKTSFIDP
jgi:hypothetical protein